MPPASIHIHMPREWKRPPPPCPFVHRWQYSFGHKKIHFHIWYSETEKRENIHPNYNVWKGKKGNEINEFDFLRSHNRSHHCVVTTCCRPFDTCVRRPRKNMIEIYLFHIFRFSRFFLGVDGASIFLHFPPFSPRPSLNEFFVHGKSIRFTPTASCKLNTNWAGDQTKKIWKFRLCGPAVDASNVNGCATPMPEICILSFQQDQIKWIDI